MNIVVCGHVDHGKSTLIGRLLYDGQQITDSKASEIQRLLEERKRKFEFSYFIDSFGEEIDQERTIDTISLSFKTNKRMYTITDVPGHREFIKNMLTGASKADAAILVVAADEGAQEQTKRHLFLLDLLGIKKLIVFINKMDKVSYDIMVYRKLSREVAQDLTRGYGFSYVRAVPGSALEGQGVFWTSIPWAEKFNEYTLVEELDRLEDIAQEKPCRILVQGAYKGCILGKVISGELGLWNKLVFEPSGGRLKVLGILGRGNCIAIRPFYKTFTPQIPRRGEVGALEGMLPKLLTSRRFTAEITLTEDGIKVGEELGIRCGTKSTLFQIGEIRKKINSETGTVLLEGDTQVVEKGESAIVEISTYERLVIDQFNSTPELGRFTIRKGNKIIGLGIIL